MTTGRVRELMETKKFSTNNAVRQHNDQDFRVYVLHPILGWGDTDVVFHNPIAAATYAVRHIIPKQVRYTGR